MESNDSWLSEACGLNRSDTIDQAAAASGGMSSVRVRVMRQGWGVALAGVVAGCSPNLQVSDLRFGDATGVYTSGNIRMVSERPREQPQLVSAEPVVFPTLCTEPSPDYAIAFSQDAKATVNIQDKGGGTLSVASNETTDPLAGRTAGVLALRDGIYAACQSYVNGVIGHDAYALILSQYGRELVELMRGGKTTISDDPAVAAARGKRKAMAALLVSCISEYDRTRIGGERAEYRNPLLDRTTCRRVMDQAELVATGSP